MLISMISLLNMKEILTSLGNIYRAPGEGWDDLWSIEQVIEVMEHGEPW